MSRRDHPVLVASIKEIAQSDSWSAIKDANVVSVVCEDEVANVELAHQQTAVGRLRRLRCPRCHRRCQQLYGPPLGCRSCLRVRHPDQQLSGSRWNKQVVLPARQIARINRRLQRTGLDQNYRRRLRRRRAKLMAKIEQELDRRQLKLETAMKLALA